MIFCIDFDGTCVERDPPLRLKPGVADALRRLKAGGHSLLLWSARNNRALRFNPDLNPLAAVRGIPATDVDRYRMQAAHQRLFADMVAFVDRVLPGVFDAVDDGTQGKPAADVFIDDRAVNPTTVGGPFASGWDWIARRFGDA